jgi:hypothetical protein
MTQNQSFPGRVKNRETPVIVAEKNGAGHTLAEKSAGSGEKLMTQADPIPQTFTPALIFWRGKSQMGITA